MAIHFFFSISFFNYFCTSVRIDWQVWLKVDCEHNVNIFETHFLHCIMDIITTVLTDLLFSTEKKVVQGRMIWNRVPLLREVYKSPGQSAFWPKGAAKWSFFPDCRVPDLEGKGLL